MILRYEHEWEDGMTDLSIELAAFLIDLTTEEGGLGKYWHFRNIVDMLWNHEDGTMKFDWNPWSERMIEHACKHKYLAVGGCASSSKTDTFALWAIVNYLADPANTRVLVTSTTLKDSRMRIWGRIVEYWDAVPGLPGKPVDSVGAIRFQDPKTGKASDKAGIFLLAGDPSKAKESIGKMIGFKRRRIIVVADELPELSPGLLEAAVSNLDANPTLQFIGIGNPSSHYDAFGVLAEPEDGWNSISAVDDEWVSKYGYCIRFDGEKSPNILAGEVIYDYMLTQEKIDGIRKRLGENSLTYWRMVRGFWCPTGAEASIYSEADIIQYDASSRDVKWQELPSRVAFLDPAFTADGDKAPVMLGKVGLSTSGYKVLLYDEEPVYLSEDITIEGEPINYQIARQYMELCIEEGVTPANAGVDSTGGGGPFCDILSVVWSPDFYRCYFGGKASDHVVSSSDDRKGHEAYTNRVSEIWFSGRELIRTHQIKGMGELFIKDAVARQYRTLKGTKGERIEVEPKVKMKARIGRSPDIGDSGFGLLDLCRLKHDIVSSETETVESKREGSSDKILRAMDHLPVSLKRASSHQKEREGFMRPKSSGFISLRR